MFVPINDNILVKRLEKETKTNGGIYIPDVAQEVPTSATVIAIGEDSKTRLRVGDKIFFGKYSGTKISIEGEEYYIVRLSEIAGYFRDNN